MKNRFLFFSIVLAATFTSCDVIDDPLKNNVGTNPNNGNDTSTAVYQRVLLEEFTGVKCNNCPAAAVEAKRLKALYGDSLLIIGVHAGNLAQTDANHPRAFRTPEGTELFNFFSFPGVPLGLVNRVDYDGIILKGKDDWREVVPELLKETPVADIQLKEKSFNESTRLLEVEGTVEIIDILPSNNIYLCLYLTENDIISPQTMPDKSVKTDYEHDHVFRGSFNTTFGEAIDVTTSNTASFTKSIVLDSEIVKENTTVIAFIYNRNNYKILQAVEIEL